MYFERMSNLSLLRRFLPWVVVYLKKVYYRYPV